MCGGIAPAKGGRSFRRAPSRRDGRTIERRGRLDGVARRRTRELCARVATGPGRNAQGSRRSAKLEMHLFYRRKRCARTQTPDDGFRWAATREPAIDAAQEERGQGDEVGLMIRRAAAVCISPALRAAAAEFIGSAFDPPVIRLKVRVAVKERILFARPTTKMS